MRFAWQGVVACAGEYLEAVLVILGGRFLHQRLWLHSLFSNLCHGHFYRNSRRRAGATGPPLAGILPASQAAIVLTEPRVAKNRPC